MYFFFLCQNLGNVGDVLQGLLVYIVNAGSLCIYCWLGNELSTEVSDSDLLKFIFILMFYFSTIQKIYIFVLKYNV